MRCIDCRWFAGSKGRESFGWLLADRKWFCLHPDREGGPFNVLQDITRQTRCHRLEPASKEKIEQREKALKILREKTCGTKSKDSRDMKYRTMGR